jgi:predicted extracellular nuclease
MRIVSAQKLLKRIKELGPDKNIIALGDFNSHYEEYKIFTRKRRLNDTNGRTGINHILGTINNQDKASYTDLKKNQFYNLWYDTSVDKRYTYIFRRKKEALDSILVTRTLLDKKGLEYKVNSIHTLHKDYLFKRSHIYRWQMSRGYPPKHKGKGYSDHLPVIAAFSY